MVKQGYVKTAEAVIAIFLSLSILAIFIHPDSTTETRRLPENALAVLRDNVDFRNCVQDNNTACINSTIRDELPNNYDFTFIVAQDAEAAAYNLPEKRIFADSVLLAGNATNSTIRIVRMFYWSKS
jgi:hypothetical protein